MTVGPPIFFYLSFILGNFIYLFKKYHPFILKYQRRYPSLSKANAFNREVNCHSLFRICHN